MKKFLAIFFALILVVSMVACDVSKSEDPTEKPTEQPTTAETKAEAESKTEANTTEDTAAETTSETTAETTSETEATTEGDAEDPFKDMSVMTYDEYAAAEMDTPVVIEAYVQATQSWWNDKIVVYLQDADGAYFAYNMACSEADAAKLVPGTKIQVKGYKGEYAGEVEILDATFTFVENGDTYIATATDVTAILGNEEELAKKMNIFAAFKGLTVVASKDASGNDVAFLYKWNGSGTEGDDLYFSVTDGTNTYSFTVESYLCGKDTDVYKAVKALNIGDKIDAEGFLYWYNGANPHITSVKVITE